MSEARRFESCCSPRQEARHEARQGRAVTPPRKIAVILHRMWMDGTSFRWSNK
jgi:hypothetical protein